MRIGFFDSGIGGLTVLNEAIKQCKGEDFLYFADTLHVPYGPKSKEEVLEGVKHSVQMMVDENIKALVIACNTATSIAVNELRRTYDIPIIGMEPAAKPAIQISQPLGKRVLVFATELTLKQTKYAELITEIDHDSIVDSLPLPELVEFCEQLNFDQDELTAFFQTKLSGFDLSQYGTIVLGCTHFPYFKSVLRRFLPPHIQLVDGSAGTVKQLKHVLSEQNILSTEGTGHIKFMCSTHDVDYIMKMQQGLAVLQSMEEE